MADYIMQGYDEPINWDEFDEPSAPWEVPPGEYLAYVNGERTGWVNLPNAGKAVRLSFTIKSDLKGGATDKVRGKQVEQIYRPRDPRSMGFLKKDLHTILGQEPPREGWLRIIQGRHARIVVTKSEKDGNVYTNFRVVEGVDNTFDSSAEGVSLGAGGVFGSGGGL